MADGANRLLETTRFKLQTPDTFDFEKPQEWPDYIRHFNRFRILSKLDTESEDYQVTTLLYTMGRMAEKVFDSFNLTTVEAKTYEFVVQKFDGYFTPKRNVIYERARFNMRSQGEGESTNSFVTDLYSLSQYCEYGALRDEMIRDRLVVGLRDIKLSETLQLDPELTLEKAVNKARQSEAVKGQQDLLRPNGRSSQENIDRVRFERHKIKHKKHVPSQNPEMWSQTGGGKTCYWCGGNKHSRQDCPAKNEKCHRCQRKGHFGRMCKNKEINEINEETKHEANDEDDEIYFAEVVINEVVQNRSNPWRANIKLNGELIRFKLDPGADGTVIPFKLYCQLNNVPEMKKSEVEVVGPNRMKIDVPGRFEGQLTYNNRSVTQSIYVARDTNEPLLGRPAIEKLQMITWDELNEVLVQPEAAYPKLFKGIGRLGTSYKIKLKDDAPPYNLSSPRRIAYALREEVKTALDKLEEKGIIKPIEEPTDWCAGLVVVPKKPKGIRLCVDLTQLNRAVKRERLILPTVEETLSQMEGAKYFSKLDANLGFYQIPLAKESTKLTTFITPFGRYCFQRLPFGICSASEVFQREMAKILEGLEGVKNHIDDIIVYGRNLEEHDQRLHATLKRLSAAGITLNEKCVFRASKLNFLGHVISEQGIQTDPDRVKAIMEMKAPTSVQELRRYFGMLNYVNKFLPGLAEISHPLRELLKKNREFTWDTTQEGAYADIRKLLSATPTLAIFDPNKNLRIQADASSFGLGAVLEQLEGKQWRPVAYISKSMTNAERSLAQIEKEALSITWACDRLADYIIGKTITIQTDHRPLISILGKKPLEELSPRLQTLRMKLMRFSYEIEHVPGRNFYIPDLLSRAPLRDTAPENTLDINEVHHSHVTDTVLQMLREEQKLDRTCELLKAHVVRGFPTKVQSVKDMEVREFWRVREELTIHDDLLLKGQRIVIPHKLRPWALKRIHCGHMGIVKCRKRAQEAVYWPGISLDIKTVIEDCPTCCKDKDNHREPLMPSNLPRHPWEVVATDIADRDGQHYLIVTDYYSRYPEVCHMKDITSDTVIQKLKSIFSRHGIPRIVHSDNGRQYVSEKFAEFARQYGFSCITSSPRYPASNGAVENAVKTVKCIMRRSEDPYLGLMEFRNTPLVDLKYSPAQLLMGRRLRSSLPVADQLLDPKTIDRKHFKLLDENAKLKQKKNFDQRHKASELPNLQANQPVWIKGLNREGWIKQQHSNPRSYLIQTKKGLVRRNRYHIKPVPLPESEEQESVHLTITTQPLNKNTGQDHTTDMPTNSITPRKTSSSRQTNVQTTGTTGSEVFPERTPIGPIGATATDTSKGIGYVTRAGRLVLPPKILDL